MARPAPEERTDIPPAARDAVAALIAAPTGPVKMLVTGGIGTGKSSVLAVVRAALRAAGLAVVTRAPRAGDPTDAAVVIDDAHLLADDELDRLVELVSDPGSTVVVAAEALTHHPGLRALATAMERENPVVTLGSLSAAEVNRVAAAALGAAPTPELLRALMVSTAGLPFLVQPAIAAAGAPEGEAPASAIAAAAKFALIERLRRVDEPVLDTLLVSSLSPDLGPDDVAAALRVSAEQAQVLVDRARASGLIEPSHNPAFLRSVHECIAQIIGAARHHETEISLLYSQIELSTLSPDLALRLAEHGLRDDRLANALADLAARSHGQPARAARLYRAAADAGATALSARLADALALTGDCTTAGRLADELLGSEDAGERAAAVRIAASIAAHDGSAAQAADLFRWLGPYPDAFVSAAGAIVVDRRRGCGRGAGGAEFGERRAADIDRAGGPQPRGGPVAVAGSAVWSRGRATGSVDHRRTAVPGCRAGQPGRVGDAGRPARRRPGAGAQRDRAGRARRRAGRELRRRTGIGCCWAGSGCRTGSWDRRPPMPPPRARRALHRRDALWAAALQTAIARRGGDAGAVQKHWYAAMEVLAEYSIDLFSLLPLGELWIAAARMRQVDQLAQPLAEAFGLLDSLGNPVLWSVPLHWAGVHAGILANSPEAVAPHGQALTAAAGHSAFAKVLAHAGRTWLRVLANHVDTDEVSAAARSLSQFGLTWDATRLAGQAALHTPDGRVSGAMLQLARDLKLTTAVDEAPGVEPATAAVERRAPASQPASTRLSDREREVAELLLLGMPYRDIGSQLFISAKTVEHHVARIRRRLGAESRSEMLSMLRAMLATQN